MPADARVPAELQTLINLLYRADWTTLSLAAEIRAVTDFDARQRMIDTAILRRANRMPHAPPPPPGASGRRGSWQEAVEEDDQPDSDEGSSLHTRTSSLLLAQGGRYRVEVPELAITEGSDGRTSWQLDLDEDEGEDADEQNRGPLAPFSVRAGLPCDELLCPAWLPARFELELAGPAVIAGREAMHVIARPRPVSRGRARLGQDRPGLGRPAHRQIPVSDQLVDQIDVLVDAELGIVLRCARSFQGDEVSRTEITSIALDPPEAGEPGRFSAPELATVYDPRDLGHTASISGPPWDAVRKVANLGASALSFAVRHAPRPPETDDSRDDTAADEPVTLDAGDPVQPGPDEPLSPALVTLLYGAGLRALDIDAELRSWTDALSVAEGFAAGASRSGLPGMSRRSDAIRDRATSWQRRELVRLGLPNRYRMEYLAGRARGKATTVASDGERRWRVYPDRVAVGPANPLPGELARYADPAWLLDWRLTGGERVLMGGRPGYLVHVWQRQDVDARTILSTVPTEVIVDAELGILLGITRAMAGKPTLHTTLSGIVLRPDRHIAEFRIDIPPGTRVVHEAGGVLDASDMPPSVKTALRMAGKAVAGAARAAGYLESLRRPKDGPADGDR